MSKELLQKILERFPEAVEESHSLHGDETVRIKPDRWLAVFSFLRDHLEFDHWIDLTAVDYLGREQGLPRFEVVVHLRRMKDGGRIRVKARLSEGGPAIDSLTSLYKGAAWMERECHEMYGIVFKDNADLRPLLLYPEFKGFPLRKDYPIDKRQPRIPLLASEERRFPKPADETAHGHDPAFSREKKK